MKRLILSVILLAASVAAFAAPVYVSNQNNFVGGYSLTFTNPNGFQAQCRVETNLGEWYNFYINPYRSFTVYLGGPSRYVWRCW